MPLPPRIYQPPSPPARPSAASWQPGDLLFFRGRGLPSRLIELATFGPSHVGGIVLYRGQPVLVESTTLCRRPCLITERILDGVQAHHPEERIADYPAGSVLRVPIRAGLRPRESVWLSEIVIDEFIGEPYDLRGAIASGTRLVKWSRWLPYPDLGSLFCSALWAHLLMRSNRLNWDDPKRFNPADLLRAVLRNATHAAPEVVRV